MTYLKKVLAFIAPPLIVGLSVSMLFSCAKIAPEEADRTSDSVFSAQQSFAAILSEAVSENPSLRSFIHTTALEQFDNDYDVFYPFVKSSVIENNLTFRDILLKYTDEKTLSSIEMTLPKLTILVPDWSWMGCFSVNSWDPAEDVAVTFKKDSGLIGVYNNGAYLGELPGGSIPAFPVLIIKDNERMIYTPGTKGSLGEYRFSNEAFDNVQTKVTHQYSEVQLDGTPDISNFVADGDVNYRVKEAFSYFSGSKAIYQRDYLYYNMTAANQSKPRNDNVWECLYKFKFQDYNSTYIHDDVTLVGDFCGIPLYYYLDFSEHPEVTELNYKKNHGWKSEDELRSAFYTTGKLDLLFLISVPSKAGGVFTTTKVKSVSFGDVFAIDHVDLDYRHRTLFCKDWFVYTIKASYIKPRWCILNWVLPRWDISQESTMITINVAEFDEVGASEFEYETRNTITNNFKIDGEASGISLGDTTSAPKLKVGLGYNHTESTESTSKHKYTRSQGGVDNLGQAEWDYLTPIVLNRTSKNGTWGYEINTITTGTVDLMIMPISY